MSPRIANITALQGFFKRDILKTIRVRDTLQCYVKSGRREC